MTVQTPPPPPGPGVIPPFPAPPVEGRGRRIGFGLGIGAAVVLLVCGGGVAAVVGLATVATKALNEQAEVVVSDYLDAVGDRNYPDAYDMLCEDARNSETESEFTSRVSAERVITEYDVGDVDLTSINTSAPVSVTFDGGDTGTLTAYLGQSSETGGLLVCSIEE